MGEQISIKKATFINFVSKYSTIFIQLILNSILARLLTPDDYGIIAVVTVFTGFFTLIADMGIRPAIIQNKSLNDRDIISIFNFTVLTGIVVSMFFGLLSYPLSLFYNNNRYLPLGFLMSFSILFSVLNIVPNALLLKEKKFKLVGIRTVVITGICGIITIILAYFKFKYYAILINSILIALFTFLFNFCSSKIKLRFILQKRSLIKIKDFSTYQFAFSVINYFSRNLDNLLIGKFMGQGALGYYDKAYKLMLYPVGNLTHVITPVLHPILSDYQHDKKYIYEQYRRIVKILSLLGVFVSVYCYFAADEAILIMFGEQWTNSIPTFKILSLTIWPQMIMSSSGTIFQSLRETKGLFRSGLITTTINVVGIVIGLLLGNIESIAFMILLTFSINFIITFIILIKMVMGYNVINFFKIFIPELGIVFFMSIILVYVSKLYITNILISAIVKCIFASIGYSLGLILTKQFTYFKLFLKR